MRVLWQTQIDGSESTPVNISGASNTNNANVNIISINKSNTILSSPQEQIQNVVVVANPSDTVRQLQTQNTEILFSSEISNSSENKTAYWFYLK